MEGTMVNRAKDTFRVDAITKDGTLIGALRQGTKENPGTMKIVEEGRPLSGEGEMFQAVYRSGTNELELEPLEDITRGKGPAKVSIPAYRKGFDRVFGKSNKDLN